MQDFDYNVIGSGYYDKVIKEGLSIRRFWHDYKFYVMREYMDTNEDSVILDIGCAAGSFLGMYDKPFKKAIGLDISPEQVAYANETYGSKKIEFIVGDGRTHEFESEKFDLIVMGEIVEHITYEQSVDLLSHIRKFLKPNGRLLITTPNYHSLWPLFEFIVNRVVPVSYEHQHINKLNPKTFKRLLEKTGYKSQRIRTVFIVGFLMAIFGMRVAKRVSELEIRLFPSQGYSIIIDASKDSSATV